jgi:DNA-binding winged helix-turn-helix (wHTH) protein/TolB-like protein/tetratricopeptide (TPR) repeat protein
MNQHPVYRFDDFVVDPEAWRLSRAGREIHLDPVVLKLLIYLIENNDRLVTRQELMDTVWGDTVISESALTKAVARLRKALGDDSATHRYLETVRSKGYRFIAELQESVSPDHADLPPVTPRKTAGRRVPFAGAAIVILLALAVFWTRSPERGTPEDGQIRSLAVIPLENLTGDPDQSYWADGLQDILITELSKVPGLRVTPRQSTKRYRDSDLTAVDIAGQLGVDALVEGSLLGTGANIKLNVQLVDGQNDAHLWAEHYSSETSLVVELMSDIAFAIGSEISPDRISAQARIGPVEPRATDAYALGITHLDRLTRDGIRIAIDQFETAVAIEPDFARAWGQLAVSQGMLGLFGFTPAREAIEKARLASLKTIEADDQFYIGHSMLGWVKFVMGDLDGGCEKFEEALRLNPSAPFALHGDADCLMLDGRMEESIDRLRELVTVDPFFAIHSLPLPIHLYVAGRLDEAIIAVQDMHVRVPHYSMHWVLALIYSEQGRLDKAMEEERLELEWRGDTVLLAALDEGLDAAGPTGAMRAMAEALVARANEFYVDPFFIGDAFARAGMVDEALHWLYEAAEHGSYRMKYVAFWPQLAPVRNDPRYQDLLQRIYGERTQEIMRVSSALRPQHQ